MGLRVTRRVNAWEMRRVFNSSGYFEAAQAGRIVVTTISDREPDPAFQQPPGTRSQVLRYEEVRDGELTKVAVVHQFLLQDGTINNRVHRPDPKMLLVDEEIWLLAR